MNKSPIPEAALTQHIALLGKTGSGKTTTGKTTTGKGLVEHLAAQKARICILDSLKSDWWGLTSSADGKHPGLPFHIIGGPRGHLPLNPLSGAAMAGLVADGSLPLSIFDMADFGPGDHARFFVEFAPVLLRKMRGVIYLVLEEAHLFAPKERSGMGDENRMIHYAKLLAQAGRSKGIRLVLLTQRTQALHNAMLGSCETVVAHRLSAPADQKPVLDWLRANAAKEIVQTVAESMSKLKTGTGWLCSGEANVFERVEFPPITTYDNSRTPTGDEAESVVRPAPVDVAALKAIMGEAAEEAQANDPKELRAEIARLKAEKSSGGPSLGDKEAAEIKRTSFGEGYAKGFVIGAEAVRDVALQILRDSQLKLDRIEMIGDRGKGDSIAFETKDGLVPLPVTSGGLVAPIPKGGPTFVYDPVGDRPGARLMDAEGDGTLAKGERAVLTTLAHYRDVNHGLLAVHTGLSERTHQKLQEDWRARLPSGEAKVLAFVCGRGGDPVRRALIDEHMGLSERTCQNLIQSLVSRRLLVRVSGGVAASTDLF